MPPRPGRLAAAVLVAALGLAACGTDDQGTNLDPAQVDAVEPPELGACRLLTPDDVTRPSNATVTVDCWETHTAETYVVDDLPDSLADVDHDDPAIGDFVYDECAPKFMTFLGADESLAMRTVVSWEWFGPSEKAWDDGARWYRCDIVGGGDQSKEFVNLPTSAKDLLTGKADDRWAVCVAGPSVEGAVKIPCSEPHDWRAVTTIKLGEDDDPYPGDRQSQIRTRSFCSDSVGAWLSYPVNYDFGYTWFHEEEWNAGNRRSVCWAKTDA